MNEDIEKTTKISETEVEFELTAPRIVFNVIDAKKQIEEKRKTIEYLNGQKKQSEDNCLEKLKEKEGEKAQVQIDHQSELSNIQEKLDETNREIDDLLANLNEASTVGVI